MLVTETWDFRERNSTSEESASEFSLSVHDLFMRVNKVIRWGNLPSESFMCFWKSFGLIYSQMFYSWAPAPVCQTHIDPHLSHQMWGIKVSPLYCSPIFSRIFANESAQSHQWRGEGWQSSQWTGYANTRCCGMIMAEVYTCLTWIETKQYTLETHTDSPLKSFQLFFFNIIFLDCSQRENYSYCDCKAYQS